MMHLGSTHVLPLRYYCLVRQWKPNYKRVRHFLSFGDAFACLRHEINLEGGVILLPSFYCEDTIEFFRRFAEVKFYPMDWKSLDVDVDSLKRILLTLKPKAIVLYNVFGKDSVLLRDTSWLMAMSPDSYIISDCAHSLLPLHDLTPLTQQHFFIDSARKCTGFMFTNCLYPNEDRFNTYKARKVSWYSLFTRTLFSVKQWLASLHFRSGIRIFAKWSESVFMVHNGIVGLSDIPHGAWFFDPIGYAHIDFKKVARIRLELWDAYSLAFSTHPMSIVEIYPFSPEQIRQMCFFPIRVPTHRVHELIAFCLEREVQVDRLWHLDKIYGLPESEQQAGMEVLVLPLTPRMNTVDVGRIVSTVIMFTSSNCIAKGADYEHHHI